MQQQQQLLLVNGDLSGLNDRDGVCDKIPNKQEQEQEEREEEEEERRKEGRKTDSDAIFVLLSTCCSSLFLSCLHLEVAGQLSRDLKWE